MLTNYNNLNPKAKWEFKDMGSSHMDKTLEQRRLKMKTRSYILRNKTNVYVNFHFT